MYLPHSELADNARIWIFQSTGFLEFEKIERVSARLMNFQREWQAHGQDLLASFDIRYDRLLSLPSQSATMNFNMPMDEMPLSPP